VGRFMSLLLVLVIKGFWNCPDAGTIDRITER